MNFKTKYTINGAITEGLTGHRASAGIPAGGHDFGVVDEVMVDRDKSMQRLVSSVVNYKKLYTDNVLSFRARH